MYFRRILCITGHMEVCRYSSSNVIASSYAGYRPCCGVLVASCSRRPGSRRQGARGGGGGAWIAPLPWLLVELVCVCVMASESSPVFSSFGLFVINKVQ